LVQLGVLLGLADTIIGWWALLATGALAWSAFYGVRVIVGALQAPKKSNCSPRSSAPRSHPDALSDECLPKNKERARRLYDHASTAASLDALLQIELSRELARLQAELRATMPDNPACCGFKVYSQADEDGILEEICRRLGLTARQLHRDRLR
jgi:hypothetical protein